MHAKTKKARLDTAARRRSEQVDGPVAGPSSERLDHAQEADIAEENADDSEDTDDDDAHDGSDDENEDDLSGISEGSVSGEDDEEDDYEDILQANEDAQAGKKKSEGTGNALITCEVLIICPLRTKTRPSHPGFRLHAFIPHFCASAHKSFTTFTSPSVG